MADAKEVRQLFCTPIRVRSRRSPGKRPERWWDTGRTSDGDVSLEIPTDGRKAREGRLSEYVSLRTEHRC